MMNPEHENPEIDRMLRETLGEEVPPEVARRMRAQLGGLRARYERSGSARRWNPFGRRDIDAGDAPRRAPFLTFRTVAFTAVLLLIMFAMIQTISLATVGRPLFDPIALWTFRNYPPEVAASYRQWRYDPLPIKSEDLDAPPFREETRAAAEEFARLWKALPDQKEILTAAKQFHPVLTRDGSPQDPLSRPLDDVLRDAAPLMAAFERLVNQPDYEIEAGAAGPVFQGATPPNGERSINLPPLPNFLAIQVMSKLLALDAVRLAKSGRDAEAWERIQTILRASKTHPHAVLISQLIGIAILNVGAGAGSDIIALCDDPTVVRGALEEQNRRADRLQFIRRDVPWNTLDLIGSLRGLKRLGLPIPPIEGVTGRDLHAISLGSSARYIEEFVLPELKDRPEDQAYVKAAASGDHNQSVLAGGPISGVRDVFLRIAGFLHAPRLYLITLPNGLEATTRESIALAKFDLLRIQMASRLFFLETGREAATLADLVPKYLPTPPHDRFPSADSPSRTSDEVQAFLPDAASGDPYAFAPVPHSIGPDGIENGASILYDPTNGTRSAGDIVLGGTHP